MAYVLYIATSIKLIIIICIIINEVGTVHFWQNATVMWRDIDVIVCT